VYIILFVEWQLIRQWKNFESSIPPTSRWFEYDSYNE